MKISVKCESDQGLLGVVRITELSIENSNGICEEQLSAKIFNALADKEYFTEQKGWKELVYRDVSKQVDFNIDEIEIE